MSLIWIPFLLILGTWEGECEMTLVPDTSCTDLFQRLIKESHGLSKHCHTASIFKRAHTAIDSALLSREENSERLYLAISRHTQLMVASIAERRWQMQKSRSDNSTSQCSFF